MNDPVKTIIGPTIALHGGGYLDFLDPDSCEFTIDGIAHGLSMVCRFAGQTKYFYSVAQHSVLVSRIVPPEDALAGLMHDAPEAFLGDVTRPLKMLLPEYRPVYKRVEESIFCRFNIPNPLPQSVKDADLAMLAIEQIRLMGHKEEWATTEGVKPANITWRCLSPEFAKQEFIARYSEMTA